MASSDGEDADRADVGGEKSLAARDPFQAAFKGFDEIGSVSRNGLG